jgi:hypothetical protein
MKKAWLFASFLMCTSKCFCADSLHAAKAAPEMASIGLLIINISELDISDNSFHIDFYLWCRWKGLIDPIKDIEFTNLEDEWDFSDTDLNTTTLHLNDGINYNSYHIRGKFTHNFHLHDYPFDKQEISITFKNPVHSSGEVVYVPDTANSNLEPGIIVPGWNIKGFKFYNQQHKYSSDFGLPEIANSNTYDNLSFTVTLYRPAQYFFWKLLLPIIIVLLSALGATIIHPKYVDARIYAPVGALLTAVFLAQSTSSKLPDISYLTLIDKVYLIAYVVILTGIFHAIYTANLVKDGSEKSVAKAKRVDKIYLVIVAVLLLFSPFLFLI